MKPNRNPPPWLLSAYTNTYLQHALNVLAQRETRRELARDISRRQMRSSPAHKAQSSRRPVASAEEVERYAVRVGGKQVHDSQNRYLHLEPYDRTRVITGHCDEGYLNGSWVLEKYGHKWWIAAQAPVPESAHSFLSVLLQPDVRPPPSLLHSDSAASTTATHDQPVSRVRTVVQLTQNVEAGRRKAHAYFPGVVGQSLFIPAPDGSQALGLKVTLLQQQSIEESLCLRSTIAVVPTTRTPNDDDEEADDAQEQTESRVVFTHLLYTSWPDHGVPTEEDRKTLISFLYLADRLNRDRSLASYPPLSQPDMNLDPDPPIIVGCSAGVGRTGTFIALSSIMRHLHVLSPAHTPTPSSALIPSALGALPEELEEDRVVQEIDSLREQRQRMVDRPEQTVFIYEVLLGNVFQSF